MMSFDKESFIQGYFLGKQDKGWCYAGNGGQVVITGNGNPFFGAFINDQFAGAFAGGVPFSGELPANS